MVPEYVRAAQTKYPTIKDELAALWTEHEELVVDRNLVRRHHTMLREARRLRGLLDYPTTISDDEVLQAHNVLLQLDTRINRNESVINKKIEDAEHRAKLADVDAILDIDRVKLEEIVVARDFEWTKVRTE